MDTGDPQTINERLISDMRRTMCERMFTTLTKGTNELAALAIGCHSLEHLTSALEVNLHKLIAELIVCEKNLAKLNGRLLK